MLLSRLLRHLLSRKNLCTYFSLFLYYLSGPNGICVSQTSAVIAQLGKCFGFYPDEADEFNGMQIVLSIADMHADGRAPFHPVKIMGSYYDQIEEAKVLFVIISSLFIQNVVHHVCRWRLQNL